MAFGTKNILIVYSSGYGTTREVSEKIYDILNLEPLFNITLKSIHEPFDVNKYDYFIIGSSIRADQLLANVRDFLSYNNNILRYKKIALFVVCLAANTLHGQHQVENTVYRQLAEKYPQLKIIDLAAFGGKIDFNKLNPVMQDLIKHVFRKTGIKANGSIDTRDWDQITRWAVSLKEKITNGNIPTVLVPIGVEQNEKN
ncbi:MAG TPA: flavodoxin domain-containing protein [bacterium]|nr:flavodoxin domain-containing protein [bacterium]HPN42798.1 flavodoxin domain-containing protein [bacterium]